MIGPSRAAAELTGLRAMWRSGLLPRMGPRALAASARAIRAYGPIGGAATVNARRFGDAKALVDERGTLTFRDLEDRSNALANAWRAQGLGPGGCVGIMCRNHRGLMDAVTAAAKLGARTVLLNTDFAGPQLRDAAQREAVTALVHDEEFGPAVAEVPASQGCFVAWADDPGDSDLERLITNGDPAPAPGPGRHGAVVILTSGTSGRPKGAPRSSAQNRSVAVPGGIVAKLQLRPGDTVFVGPPLFHTWGLSAAGLTLGLGSTLVLRRRFDTQAVLADLATHRCTAFMAVPVMLNRLLATENLDAHDLSALRLIATGAAPLDAPLARRAIEKFGDVLYNIYGSTETASITIADPADLKAAPGCVGRPVLGVTVKILDQAGRRAPAGTTGRIFVKSPLTFAGYTGGGGKERIGGFLDIGDLGHLDDAGRLFIDGRADDMIVSGGENVYPAEIEELLTGHESVREAAVIGVADQEFGQRLRAFVVAADQVSEDDLKKYVSANLARYKVPRDVILLDELPRNPSGKVLKRELSQWTAPATG